MIKLEAGRSTDILVAEALGAKVFEWGTDFCVASSKKFYQEAVEQQSWTISTLNGIPEYCSRLPHYSTDLQDSKYMEDRLERMELHLNYAMFLLEIFEGKWNVKIGSYVLWNMIRATPLQRCMAALMVLEEV